MTKDLMILGLGAWVALVPFLGFPNRLDTFIFVISGLLIIVLMLLLRRDFINHITRMKTSSGEKSESTFVEKIGRNNASSPPPSSALPQRHISVKHESDHDNGIVKEKNS